MKSRFRNTHAVVDSSLSHLKSAVENNLMHVTIKGRDGKYVVMPDGRRMVEFINCSYLGLDTNPQILEAYKSVDEQWGVSFCCARSRFSIELNQVLEEKLSEHFRGRVIIYPSVTTTHISTMPLLASGVLINPKNPPKVHFIFDRFSHASMQFLKPLLSEEATVETIPHNDLSVLRSSVISARARNQVSIYVADGVYSMGGLCPISEVLKMSEELDFYLYIDDAHGTSIFGDRGEGSVFKHFKGSIPENLFLTFSMSKGFGVGGGGVVFPDREKEKLARYYGQIYAFSAPLEYSVMQACLKSLELHHDGTVTALQEKLRSNVAHFDRELNLSAPFSPIRMVTIGDEYKTIDVAQKLLNDGFFVSAAFFPVVPKGKSQLRLCISATHTKDQLEALARSVRSILPVHSHHIWATNYVQDTIEI